MKRKITKQFSSGDVTYYVGDIITQHTHPEYPYYWKKKYSTEYNEITNFGIDYHTVEINDIDDIDVIKNELLHYTTHFYIGGGDTDHLEASFEEKLNELIQAVRRQSA